MPGQGCLRLAKRIVAWLGCLAGEHEVGHARFFDGILKLAERNKRIVRRHLRSLQAEPAKLRVAHDCEHIHLGKRRGGVLDRCHRRVAGELRGVVNAEVDRVADLDIQLLGQALVDDDAVLGNLGEFRLLEGEFPKRVVDAHDDHVVGAALAGRALSYAGQLQQCSGVGTEIGLKLCGQFGPEKSVVRGQGQLDLAKARLGHVAQTAPDRFADQQRADQHHRADCHAKQGADVAPRIVAERVEYQ